MRRSVPCARTLRVLAGTILALCGCSDLLPGVSRFRVRITAPADGAVILAGDALEFGASIKGGSTPYDVEWDFDGAAPPSKAETPGPVAFPAPGTFTVTVRCTDGWNNTAEASVTVTVVPLVARIDAPADGAAVPMGGAVDFQGTVLGGAAPFAFAWDFDGAAPASTVEDPGNVAFPWGRTYRVTFTVTDANNDSDAAAVDVVVVDPSLPTKAQIIAYWNAVKPARTTSTWTSVPVLTVDDSASEGVLDPALVAEGVAWTNFYRWLAGLPDDVVEDPLWTVRCQKGAHVLTLLKILDDPAPNLHDPPVPTGATALYQSDIYGGPATVAANTGGWIACASGVIARGWGCPPYTPPVAVDWLVNDNGVPSLGHRRLILNPRLSKTAFGVVGDASAWASVQYTTERPTFSAPMPAFDFVAYPGRGFYPAQCFLLPQTEWSFSANPTKYDLDALTAVTVVRRSDGADLGVTTALKGPSAGLTPTVGFDPREGTLGETYVVTVRDILDLGTAQRFDYSYEVTFFDLEE